MENNLIQITYLFSLNALFSGAISRLLEENFDSQLNKPSGTHVWKSGGEWAASKRDVLRKVHGLSDAAIRQKLKSKSIVISLAIAVIFAIVHLNSSYFELSLSAVKMLIPFIFFAAYFLWGRDIFWLFQNIYSRSTKKIGYLILIFGYLLFPLFMLLSDIIHFRQFVTPFFFIFFLGSIICYLYYTKKKGYAIYPTYQDMCRFVEAQGSHQKFQLKLRYTIYSVLKYFFLILLIIYSFYHFLNSSNLMESCKKNALLFANGANDIFPIWFLQLVKG
jgi:hypothetical protein